MKKHGIKETNNVIGNMLTDDQLEFVTGGVAPNMDGEIITVSVEEEDGVMPQTREHLLL